jgi:hypothetical protein
MKITNFLSCEYASQDASGKVTLVGAGIDWFSFPQFPMAVRLYLFARCVADLNDVPGKKVARLKLMGDDKLITHNEIPFQTLEGQPNINIITAYDLHTEKPALFRFNLSIDGSDQVATWPLEIRKA